MPHFKTKEEFYTKYASQIGTLRSKFEGYLVNITQKQIRDYLCQFTLDDKPVGLKLLQKIDYYSNERINRLTKQLGGKLKKVTNTKFDDVYFCPIDSSSGSSTDTIIRKLRNFMGMDNAKYDEKFIHVSDLDDFAMGPEVHIANIRDRINHILSLSDDDISDLERNSQIADLREQIEFLQHDANQLLPKTIVFVDDYIGSGNSFKDFWSQIGTYYNENHNYILSTLIAHQQGINFITSEIPIKIVIPTKPIPLSAKIFHNKNKQFTKIEKQTIKKYCDQLGFPIDNRYGFMNTQSMSIIYERSSNNILPILYAKTDNWIPLFPRTI